jgi:hypothetical protein
MDKAVDQRAYRTFAGRDIFVLFFFYNYFIYLFDLLDESK